MGEEWSHLVCAVSCMVAARVTILPGGGRIKLAEALLHRHPPTRVSTGDVPALTEVHTRIPYTPKSHTVQ